ncbi:hypothetical protein J4Q44_G00216130 [Coregonus suidteri]|uniref:Uncharacterized protein n=1 Tax=Coregonus suidteri TaxID=861788 RepID=A0AAN8LAR6_9TELE
MRRYQAGAGPVLISPNPCLSLCGLWCPSGCGHGTWTVLPGYTCSSLSPPSGQLSSAGCCHTAPTSSSQGRQELRERLPTSKRTTALS